MKKIIVINRKGGCGKTTICLSLADAIEKRGDTVKVVDLDNQKTLTMAAEITKRHVPVPINSSRSAKYFIVDTPPYEDLSLKNILETGDIIVIPCLVGYPDLFGCKSIYDYLLKKGIVKKACILFNKVRKPHNKSYSDIRTFFRKNYPKIKIAKTELTLLRGYQDVLAKPLQGKALDEINAFLEELNV